MIRSWETKNMDIQWKQVWMEDEYLTADGDGLIEGSDSTVTSSPLDLDEATLSPPLSPGVLDEPVVLTTLSAVADNKNGMVHLVDAVRIRGSIAAASGLQDTTAIVAPVTVGRDSSDDRGHLEHGGHVRLIREELVVHAGDLEVLIVATAAWVASGDISGVSRSVAVGRLFLVVGVLSAQPVQVGLRPGPITAISSPHISSINKLMTVGTVKDVLFREIISHDTVDSRTGLNGTHGSKSSTASTLALVLDRADLALVNPVELLQDRHLGHLLNNGIIDVVNENSVLIKSWQTSSSLLHEFLGGKIHVFCDLHKPGLLTSFIPLVVLNHLLVVGIEDSPPLGKLSRGLVGLAKGPVEALEVMLGRSQPNNSQQHEESHGDPGILSPC